MKKALWLIATLVVLVLVALAALVWENTGGPAKQSVSPQPQYNYTFDKKEVFEEDASADLSEFDQGIKQLSGLAAAAGTNVQAQAQIKIQDLGKERAALGQKLDALKNAHEANWNDLKSDFQKS